MRIVPARSHDRFELAADPGMKLHVETEDLARRIAEALREHEERLLSELTARIARELTATPNTSAGIGLSDDPKIMGIEPHGLYPVSFVADRWDVSEDNVRKKPEVELPRSDWRGGEIRYRGVDILRYEGVDVEAHVDELPFQRESERAEQSPEPPQSNGGHSPTTTQTGNGRPYNSELPSLSDEESPAD